MKYKTFIFSVIAIIGTLVMGFTFINAKYTSYVMDTEIGIPTVEAATSTEGLISIINNTNPLSPKSSATTRKTDYPTKIEIPSLKIKATIQPRGLNAKGEMATPTNFRDVAWYKLGTLPGNPGSSVMAGHLDNALALSGVFKNLSALKPGADIYVTMNSGKKLHFVVEEKGLYDYDKAPLEIIFNRKDKARLNLVTCAGIWIKEKKTYSQRLVVYASLK